MWGGTSANERRKAQHRQQPEGELGSAHITIRHFGIGEKFPVRERTSRRLKMAGALIFAAVIVFLWAGPTTLYCWDGARNVSREEPPDVAFVVVLVVMGFLPWLCGMAYVLPMRRRQTTASTVTFGTMVVALVTLPVLIVRTIMAAPFF